MRTRSRWLALGLLGISGLGYLGWRVVGPIRGFLASRPDQAFDLARAPAAPDYTQTTFWGALPEREDPSDWLLPDEPAPAPDSRAADVFYLHPTTYYGRTWNQPPLDRAANAVSDEFALRNQAAAFNACCRIYSPRYRQAVMHAFFDPLGNGAEALELAYRDVERAFEQFASERSPSRPFLLVGHSQGALHLRTLLERRVSGTPLRDRLVAAYLVGIRVSRRELAERAPDVDVCASPTQTGCVLSWNTVGPDAYTFGYSDDVVCVNPLSWRADEARVEHDRHEGAVAFARMDATSAESLHGPWDPQIETGAAAARCERGRLVVEEIRAPQFAPIGMARDSHHIHDFNLFYLNVRRNAKQRVESFVAARER